MPTRRPTHLLPLLFITLALVAAPGCSGFQNQWKRAAVADAPADDHLAGRWKGSWKSDKSGHSGGLR